MTGLFSYFSSATSVLYFPGAAFMCAALLTLISIIMLAPLFRRLRTSSLTTNPASDP